MHRVLVSLVCVVAIAGIAYAQKPSAVPDWRPPPQGMVPDAATAITVALAVLPSLGSKAVREIKEDAPWHATKVGDAWQVSGTLPADMLGGTYIVVIAQRNARVIRIYHEQ